MKRTTSGWLAWGALALIIIVPSSDVFFSKSKKNIALENSVNTGLPIIAPVKENIQDAPVIPMVQQQLKETNLSLIDETQPKTIITLVEDDFIIAKPLSAPIPIEFRLVGDQQLRIAETEVKDEDEEVQTTTTRVVGDVGMTIGSNVTISKQHDTQDKPILRFDSQTFEMIEGENDEVKFDDDNGIDEEFLLASVELEAPVEIKEEVVAKKPTLSSSIIRIKSGNSRLSTLVKPKSKSRANVIDLQVQNNLKQVNFYELVSASQGSSNIITINNSVQNNRQRLDRINTKNMNNFGRSRNSQFQEIWHVGQISHDYITQGSFISQLPSQRGSAIRLDRIN